MVTCGMSYSTFVGSKGGLDDKVSHCTYYSQEGTLTENNLPKHPNPLFSTQPLACADEGNGSTGTVTVNNTASKKSIPTPEATTPKPPPSSATKVPSPVPDTTLKGVDYSKRKPLTLKERQSRFGVRSIADATANVKLEALKKFPAEWVAKFKVRF